ncbi:MAG TPA: 5-oxoprolinase subunit PxpA [Candidatus Dormibacteraeota bacterium]
MINLNSDLGEAVGHDDEILPFIDSANVACGVHAGSASESIRTVRRCQELGVEVGAHPGYDDRDNFGRIEIELSPADIEALVRFQVGALAALAPIGYIKVHGALYHYCQARPEAADALARVAAEFETGLVGQPGFEILAACERAGIPGYRDGYADRAYLPDGRLAPRSQPGSVLPPEQAAEQAIRLARGGGFDSICLHGDSPGAPHVARTIREALKAEGIETGPLSRRR